MTAIKKPFIANLETHEELCLGYSRFPEIPEVFGNIVKDDSLCKNILSAWKGTMLEGHIRHFILPSLLKFKVIREDHSRKCGFATDYTSILFESTVVECAHIAAQRANLIGKSVMAHESFEDVLSVNIVAERMSAGECAFLYNKIREILKPYSSFDSTDTQSQSGERTLRLALVARAEKTADNLVPQA
jgi:hypothetical protein